MAIEIGSKVTGKVTGITNFGAFIDLGSGQSGLVHISEISNEYVKDIHDVLSVGDTVTVKVISEQKGKIGLSMKQVDHPSPAHHAKSTHGGERRHNERAPRRNRYNRHHEHHDKPKDFDSMLSGFLKESEDRLTAIKRNTEGKRGGRGGRRG